MVLSLVSFWKGHTIKAGADSDYQRSHLRTLKNFVVKSEKSGKHLIKSGNREILKRLIFFLYPRLNQGHQETCQ